MILQGAEDGSAREAGGGGRVDALRAVAVVVTWVAVGGAVSYGIVAFVEAIGGRPSALDLGLAFLAGAAAGWWAAGRVLRLIADLAPTLPAPGRAR